MKILNYLKVTKGEVREEQKELVAQTLKRKQKALINKLEDEISNVELKLIAKTSIRVDEVNTDTYMEEYMELTTQKELLKIDLKLAKGVYKDLFKEEKEVE